MYFYEMSLTKKSVLQETLSVLVPYRDPAEWFLLLLKDSKDENLIDALYETITMEMWKIKNSKNANEMKK